MKAESGADRDLTCRTHQGLAGGCRSIGDQESMRGHYETD